MPEQIPAAGSPVDPQQQPQAGSTPESPQAGTSQPTLTPLTHEQALAELARVRHESAERRVKLTQLEQAQQEAERAKLSKQEQLQAKIADLERAQSERDRAHQERTVKYEVQLHASKLGIMHPDAAAKLLDWSQLEYAEDGSPKNAQKLLKDLVAAMPELAGPIPSGSVANPPTTNSHSLTFTQAQIAAMSPEDYRKNRVAIFTAQKEGKIIG
jgi:multidrug efflux pump subunit AcrA (membrane-fusion protein)